MIDVLLPVFSKPIEREYEGWLVRGIEKYFQELGIFAVVWAVSPSVESTWPADEHLYMSGKIIGLQMKKANISQNHNPDFTNLHWKLHNPKGQFKLIQKRNEIYYCLPTFLNRKWRDKALEHCIFWRPANAVNYNLWYDNPIKGNPYNKISTHPNALRWGYFYEKVMACDIGVRLSMDLTLHKYLSDLQTSIRQELMWIDQMEKNITRGLYLIYLNI
ncbi:hypothetical protein [Nostoc sp.]|uniref:hypothetical protein n=1 Tax=Nostoc sp. TaxID=1180 RepID=UPI002FFD1D31